MIGIGPISQEKLDALKEELGERGQDVAELVAKWREDMDGEPALWVWIVMRADVGEAAWSWENREALRGKLRAMLEAEGVPASLFINFRDAAELAGIATGADA